MSAITGYHAHVYFDAETREQAHKLVAKAHEVCPYSNATRGNIPVDITVDGKPVELSA